MDYLQQATERARKRREGELGKTVTPGEDAAFNAGVTEAEPGTVWDSLAGDKAATAAPRPVHKSAGATSAADVEFTRTRRVEPADATLEANRVITALTNDARVEVYRQLRSQVLGTLRKQGWSTLAITSPNEGAGKTVTALNLAIAMAQEVNQTVLLVDLDLRKPELHTNLGIEVDKGIVDHLRGDAALADVLIAPGFKRLVLLPGLPQGRHSSELLSAPAMARFLEDVTSRYPDRYVVFDLPPLLRDDDAMVFTPMVDCALLVVEDGVTRPDEIERARQLLGDTPLLGSILNKAR